MKPRFIFLIPSMLILYGCASWTEIPAPNAYPRITLNAIFNPDSIWRIYLRSNLALTDTSKNGVPIENAIVTLWSGDSLLGICNHVGAGVYIFNLKPQSGIMYKVTAQAPGYPNVEASSYIPAKTTHITGSIDLGIPYPRVNDLGAIYPAFQSSIIFNDDILISNYYRISLAARDSFSGFISSVQAQITDPYEDDLLMLSITSDDPSQTRYASRNGFALINDELFNGSSKQINLYLADTTLWLYKNILADTSGTRYMLPNGELVRVHARLYADVWSMSTDLFQYYTTYLSQSYGITDPFSVYLNVYNNVMGGYGVFAGYNRSLVLIYET